jgi:hypothetical protein
LPPDLFFFFWTKIDTVCPVHQIRGTVRTVPYQGTWKKCAWIVSKRESLANQSGARERANKTLTKRKKKRNELGFPGVAACNRQAVEHGRTGDACCPGHGENASDNVSGMVGVAKEEREKRCLATRRCHKRQNTRVAGMGPCSVTKGGSASRKARGGAVPNLAQKSSFRP